MPITPTREVSSTNASSHLLRQVRNVELDVKCGIGCVQLYPSGLSTANGVLYGCLKRRKGLWVMVHQVVEKTT